MPPPLPVRRCNVHGFRGFPARTMSAASLLAKDKAARRATLEVVASESGRNLLGKDAGMRRASAETRRAAVAVGEQLIAKSAGRSDESAWLKAKRLLLAAASGQMVDKGDAASARRLSHNETIRPRSAVKKDAQWMLSLAEMDTVKRIASIPAATRAPEETTELLHVLRSSSLFLSLDETTAMALAGALAWQEYEQGEQVFAEHQVGDSFYLIVIGSAAVLMRDQEAKDSTVVSAAELYAGDAFGEASFHDLKQRSVSVCALEPTVALRVQRDDYVCSLRTWHAEQSRRKLALLASVPLLAAGLGVTEVRRRPLTLNLSLSLTLTLTLTLALALTLTLARTRTRTRTLTRTRSRTLPRRAACCGRGRSGSSRRACVAGSA